MKITPEKGQFLVAALDNYVKEKGLAVAGMAAMVLAEIQADLTQAAKPVESAPAPKTKAAPAARSKKS